MTFPLTQSPSSFPFRVRIRFRFITPNICRGHPIRLVLRREHAAFPRVPVTRVAGSKSPPVPLVLTPLASDSYQHSRSHTPRKIRESRANIKTGIDVEAWWYSRTFFTVSIICIIILSLDKQALVSIWYSFYIF